MITFLYSLFIFIYCCVQNILNCGFYRNRIDSKLAEWRLLNPFYMHAFGKPAETVLWAGEDTGQRLPAGSCFAFPGTSGNITIALTTVVSRFKLTAV